MKRGLVIGAALCVAALVTFFLLRGHGATSSTASSGSATGSNAATKSSRAVDIARTGRRIAGVVVGEDNQPIAGAHVQLASKETIRAPMIVTSADGAFDFGVKAPLVYAVFADAPKLTGAAYELDLGDPQTASEKLRLVLHACDASIHGVVHDTVGGTVAGALVSRTAGRARSTTGAVSDATGNYELCIPSGGDDVVVTADGYATVHENVNVFGRTARDFVLAPGGTVTGKVVRASDKAPVDGATVALREKDGDSELYTTSNEDGTFTIDGVLPGRRVVSAYVDKLMTLDPPEIAVEIGAPTEVTCEVSPVATLSGRLVLESDHSVGVPNMDVFLGPTTNQGDPWQSVKTASDGAFVFDRVRPGDYEASPRGAKRDKRTPIHVTDADIANLTLTTAAPSSVAGRVLLDGKPVDGAMVQARSEMQSISMTTDSEGKFLFEGLTRDTVQLYAQSTRLGAFTNGPTLTLAPGEKKTGLDIPLDLAGSVAGVVVDQNNAPLSGVYVRFVLVGGGDQGEATTADDGSFTARAMSGGGDYAYEVRERADSPNVFPPTEGKRFPPIKVADGSTHITGLHLKVKRERLTISGRVVDGDGAGISDATVHAESTRMGGRYMPPITATTDQTGAYIVRDLTRGSYSMSASAARGESDDLIREAGTTNVVLTLQTLGSLDVILDGYTVPVTLSIQARERTGRYNGTRSGNTVHFRNIFPGNYDLEVYAKNDMFERSVEVAAGTTTTLTLQPRPLGRIDGVLVDAITKNPIEDARCATMGTRPTETDRSGAFQVPAPVGVIPISCWKTGYDVTTIEVTIVENQSTRAELAATPSASETTKKVSSGITLANQLSDIVVNAVEPNSPGARAGLQVGDVLTKVDGGDPIDASYIQYEVLRSGQNVTMEIERGDKTLTITIVYE